MPDSPIAREPSRRPMPRPVDPLGSPRPVCLLLLLLALGGCGTGESRAPWNVLLIVVDTLRPDHLGVYGYERDTSPVLDALAARSLVLERAYAQSSWTKPSVASLLTSLYPNRHRVLLESPADRLADDLLTLPEVLQAAGYRTAAISRNPHIQPGTGFSQGFGDFRGRPGWIWSDNNALVALDAVDFLRGTRRDRPFFLYVHFLDPHDPFIPPPRCRGAFVEGLSSTHPDVQAGRVFRLLDEDDGERLRAPLARSDLAYLIALYDAEICAVDAAIGSMLDELERSDLAQRTLVVVTADHGEGFLEHDRLRHGYDLYDEAIRVPLILHVPGAAPRVEGEAIVQQIDLAPTLLDVLGVPIPSSFEGRSFAPLLEGAEPERPAIAVAETAWRGLRRRALRTADWKLVVDHADGSVELYDLHSDPGEHRDVSAERPEIAERLAAQLIESAGPLREPEDEALLPAGGPELEEALRRLGYLER